MEEKPIAIQEFELLKKTFKGNKELLRQIRTLLLGFDISDEYKTLIKTTFSDPLVFRAFRKKLFTIWAEDAAEAPLESMNDNWTNSTQIIGSGLQDRIYQEVWMRQKTQDMLKKGILLLLDPNGERVQTDYNPNNISDPWGIELMARNYYISSIQQGISNLSIMISSEALTPQEKKTRAKKDSTE